MNNSHVIPGLIRKFDDAKINNHKSVLCWGSGAPLREFLFVDDFAEACLFTLENWLPSFKKSKKGSNADELCWLNIGSDDEITIRDLAIMISELIGYEGEINWDLSKPDGTPRKKLDNTRINNLGWTPKTTLRIGINKTIQAYKNEKLLKINRC